MLAEIDYLINLDIGNRNNRSLRGAVPQSNPPIDTASGILHDRLSEGDSVFITTGFPILPDVNPETDGPLGAALLGSAIEQLGGRPVYLIEDMTTSVMRAAVQEVGVKNYEMKNFSNIATDQSSWEANLIDTYHPCGIVAVEKPGRCSDDTYRNMNGKDVSDFVDPIDNIFEEAQTRNIPTISVGDGGNEIGMGNIESTVRSQIDNGETIASVTTVDSLIVAGVSNWGAYGLVSGLSIRSGSNLLHDAEMEKKLIDTCFNNGAVDGVTGDRTGGVDGLGPDIHAVVVTLLNELTSIGLAHS